MVAAPCFVSFAACCKLKPHASSKRGLDKKFLLRITALL